jgi:hypothetical protein
MSLPRFDYHLGLASIHLTIIAVAAQLTVHRWPNGPG